MRLQACVRNGRLELSEPTELPEGEVVELMPIAEIGDAADDLDESERAQLHATIDRSRRELAAGQGVDVRVALRRLRSK